jgi:DNA polymerase sigma
MLTRTRIPVVKMRDPVSNVRCDISFHGPSAVHVARLMETYARIDGRFIELVRIVKYWARRRGINEPCFGTLPR